MEEGRASEEGWQVRMGLDGWRREERAWCDGWVKGAKSAFVLVVIL